MPFPNCTFGKELDPREMSKLAVEARGPKYHWSRLTKCDDRCPFYDKGCAFISISKMQNNGDCAIKKLPDAAQNRIVRSLEQSETGWMANIIEVFLEIENTVRNLPMNTDVEREKRTRKLYELQTRMIEMYKTFHGNKVQVESKNVNLNMNMSPKELLDAIDQELTEREQSMKKVEPDEIHEDVANRSASDDRTDPQ